MTAKSNLVLICTIDHAAIAAAHAGTQRLRTIYAHARCTQARAAPGLRQTALQKMVDSRHRA